MRIVAILVLIFLGAGLLAVDQLSDSYGKADDFGMFTFAVGLLALGIELYVLPIIKWKLNRD